MRRALTNAFGAALVALALTATRPSHAADGHPIVRIVLVTGGETAPWFDGFVKHLERELGLRGIDVAVSRGARASSTQPGGSGSQPGAPADAELVVEIPSARRPVLRFSVAPREPGASSEVSSAGRVREVNLAGVPADGCALALAAAADELMRSNWPRAAPVETSRSASSETKPSPTADATTATTASGSAPADAPKPAAAQAATETPRGTARSVRSDDGQARADASEPDALPSRAAGGLRSAIGAAAAVEAFGGGQTQLGADLHWAVRILPQLDAELRGGWRSILRRETANGAVDGTALVAGAALGAVVLRGARLDLTVVGRADLVRVAYRGEARDATVTASDGGAFGLVVAAGPRARLALTRAVGLEAEVATGASLLATTATDAGVAAFSTKGGALLASLGLSLGL